MPHKNRLAAFALAASCSLGLGAARAATQITVHADKPGVSVRPELYGMMTEEINHAYDGGLYAELIQNRAFKDNNNNPVHWSLVQDGGGSGQIALTDNDPVNANLAKSLKLTVATPGKRVGVANDGFWGIPVKPNTTYKASFYAQAADGFDGPLTVTLEAADGSKVFASAKTGKIGAGWQKYSVTLKTGKVTPSLTNRFVIAADHAGSVRLSFVSLFPPTYKNRPNGNRIDLMEKMAAMKPAFLRLPGGNYVDPGHYIWKNTLGPIDQRPGSGGAWGYHISEGLGILEFLEWCEDLKIEPVLAVTDGRPWLPADGDVSPLIQDALDEIEYVSGDVTTKWGARRAQDGHPAPFPLRYVEIGNEDFFDPLPTYESRFAKFFDAIRAKYPKLQIIATRSDIKARVPDIFDEHYYRSAQDMFSHAHQYDTYPRTGPKIFVGEWAATEGSPTPTLKAALGDAAWLTGIERNADIVIMECYAPLFVNVNPGAAQWGTNLIGYDALTSFGSPSYYVQRMFGNYHGDTSLPIEVQPDSMAPAAPAPHGGIGVATWNTHAEFKDMKVTQGGTTVYQADLANHAGDWKEPSGAWAVQDGVLVQNSDATDARATAGDAGWTDYTYTLKAKKISGAEGFLIMFHNVDSDNYIWWNIGGWGNTLSVLEESYHGTKARLGAQKDFQVETGRWYDIRVEVAGRSIKCYLDGKLMHEEVDNPPMPTPPVFASATRETKSGDIFLHLVNSTDTVQPLTIDLQGVPSPGKTAKGEVISGAPSAVNTIQSPENVAPKPLTINGVASKFSHDLPPHSVSVVRVKAK